MSQGTVSTCQTYQGRKYYVDLACALQSQTNKHLAIFYKFMLKTNKSSLYRIKINDVALVLGTYLQITKHCLCSRDASGLGSALKC